MHSGLSNIPNVITRAVVLGLWSSDQALQLVEQTESALHKIRLYTALLETKTGTTGLLPALIQTAFDVEIKQGWGGNNEQAVGKMFALLAPYFTTGEVEQAVYHVFQIRNWMAMKTALEALIPRLSPESLSALLDRVLPNRAPTSDKPHLMALVSDRLPEYELKARLEILDVLAPHLPEILAKQVFEVVDTIELDSLFCDRVARILSNIAVFVTECESLFSKIMNACFQTGSLLSSDNLAKVMPLMSEEQVKGVLERVREVDWGRFDGLLLVGVRLNDRHLLDEALSLIPTLHSGTPDSIDDERRAGAMMRIAPHLPNDLLPRALEIAREIRSNRERAYALGALARRFQGETQQKIFHEALDAAFHPRISNITYQAGSLEGFLSFATALHGDALNRAIEFLLSPIDPGDMIEILGEEYRDSVENAYREWRLKALNEIAAQMTREEIVGVLVAYR